MTYRWNAGAGRYRAPSGRFVPMEAVRDLLEDRMQDAGERMGLASGRLAAGRITVAEWRDAMAKELKHVHIAGSALGRGGWHTMDENARRWTANRIRSEIGYLDRFAAQIAAGEIPFDGRFEVRASMYAQSAWSTMEASRRDDRYQQGHRWERNVMSSVEPCDQCISVTAAGWQPLGSLPEIGARSCLSNDRCSWLTSAAGEMPGDDEW